jgi:cell division protein FtsB
MSSLRTKVLPIILVLLLIFLQYRLWFDNGGILDMLRAKKQLALQTQFNEKLKKRNEKLSRQVHYLQASNEAVESRARSELGMIKKDETYYQVVKSK